MSAVARDGGIGVEALEVPVRELIRGAWFCSNPACVLHVRTGDSCVAGTGEWAIRPDGVVTSRAMYGDRMLCDVCGQRWLTGRA